MLSGSASRQGAPLALRSAGLRRLIPIGKGFSILCLTVNHLRRQSDCDKIFAADEWRDPCADFLPHRPDRGRSRDLDLVQGGHRATTPHRPKRRRQRAGDRCKAKLPPPRATPLDPPGAGPRRGRHRIRRSQLCHQARDTAADEVKGVASALRTAADELRGGSPQERSFGLADGLADVSDACATRTWAK